MIFKADKTNIGPCCRDRFKDSVRQMEADLVVGMGSPQIRVDPSPPNSPPCLRLLKHSAIMYQSTTKGTIQKNNLSCSVSFIFRNTRV